MVGSMKDLHHKDGKTSFDTLMLRVCSPVSLCQAVGHLICSIVSY